MLNTTPSQSSTSNNLNDLTLPKDTPSVDQSKRTLPIDYTPYTDKYFLRTLEILQKEALNPFVRSQIFIRNGPGLVGGVNDALAIIDKYGDLVKNGGRVYSLLEGQGFNAGDTVMVIEGFLQDFVALETMCLGVISQRTTQYSDGVTEINFSKVRERARQIKEATEGRQCIYFGARHWSYSDDGIISFAAREGGFNSASTDAGAAVFGKKGEGTIPHVLENAYAVRYGRSSAVVEATKAFDRVIDPNVKRIALIDYNNKEVEDSLSVARELQDRLYGVRVDTCGENVAQGAIEDGSGMSAKNWRSIGIPLLEASDPDSRYWYGRGVTVTGVYSIRKALDENGFSYVKIVLTSGFGDVNKVKAFTRAEKILGVKLYDSLGVGQIYPSRTSTMDVVAVRNEGGEFAPLSKVGRSFRPNPNLKLMIS